MPDATVPVLVLEEHHEAFLVWWLARRAGVLGPEPASVLHVDEHADWALPRFARPLQQSETDAERVAEFVYNELNIATFLWAAVYYGLAKEVCWLRARHIERSESRHLYIATSNDECTEFLTGTYRSFPPADMLPDCRTVRYDMVEPSETREFVRPFLLDIDLDFFASNRRPDLNCRVEITESAYRQFTDDPYHALRILPGSRVSVVRDANRFYLVFGAAVSRDTWGPFTWSEETALERAAGLRGFLERAHVIPDLVTISRSVRCGYTPKAVATAIERACLAALAGVYACQVQDLAGRPWPEIEERLRYRAKP